MRTIKLYLILLCCVLLCACRSEEETVETYSTEMFKVAVIAPGNLLPYWQRTAEWAQEIGRAHV